MIQLYNSDEGNALEHWDVSTAFIHAPLKEQVWMKQASGHEEKGKETWVCLLLKALYGTKQAAHAWQQHLKAIMGRGWLCTVGIGSGDICEACWRGMGCCWDPCGRPLCFIMLEGSWAKGNLMETPCAEGRKLH